MAAQQRMLHIPEVLEIILLELEPQELLQTRRVSKAFDATIRGSAPLQRTLFYQQDQAPSNHRPRINPFIGRALRPFVKIRVGILHSEMCEEYHSNHKKPHQTPYCISIEVRGWWELRMQKFTNALEVIPYSWHDMHLTSKPCDVAIENDSMDGNDLQLSSDAKISDLVRGIRAVYTEGVWPTE